MHKRENIVQYTDWEAWITYTICFGRARVERLFGKHILLSPPQFHHDIFHSELSIPENLILFSISNLSYKNLKNPRSLLTASHRYPFHRELPIHRRFSSYSYLNHCCRLHFLRKVSLSWKLQEFSIEFLMPDSNLIISPEEAYKKFSSLLKASHQCLFPPQNFNSEENLKLFISISTL